MYERGRLSNTPNPPRTEVLPVLKWVPGKTDSRLKILQRRIALECLVVKTGTSSKTLKVGDTGAIGVGILPESLQLVDLILCLRGNRCYFVAQTQIESQVRTELPIVLVVACEDLLPVMVCCGPAREGRKRGHADFGGYVLEKILIRGKRCAAAASGSLAPVLMIIRGT